MEKLIGIGFWEDGRFARVLQQSKSIQEELYRKKYIEKYRHRYKDDVLVQPHHLINELWYVGKDKNKIVKYLDEGKDIASYMGKSKCRICQQSLGSHDLTDGRYLWPEKFSHYISEHNICLPDFFFRHMVGKDYKIPVLENFNIVTQGVDDPYDKTQWNEWVLGVKK